MTDDGRFERGGKPSHGCGAMLLATTVLWAVAVFAGYMLLK